VDVDDGFLRGHGTRVADGRLLATVCGTVERVNKLVSVRPLRTRYVPETGDVVLGRVVDIAGKRWKLDIGGRQDAVLQLGAVHLPGGAQRRRNAVDELNMRSLYKENDLISCEVQSFYADGAVALHTRSLKYGRLADGQLVRVPPTLVKRVKRHFHAIDAANAFGGDDGLAEETMSGNDGNDNKRKREHTGDVEVLLGCNGFVWVGARSAATGELNDDELNARDEDDVKKKTKRVQRVVSRAQRERVCRVANAVRVLSALFLAIHPPAIEDVSLCSVEWGTRPKDMLSHAFLVRILERETERRLAKGGA
jgi:exosome complex component RRP4